MFKVLILLSFAAAVVTGSKLHKPEDALPVRQQRVVGLALAGLGVAQALKPLAAAATVAGVAPLFLANLPGKGDNTGPSNEIVVIDGSFPRSPGVINPLASSGTQTLVPGFLGPFVTGRQNMGNAESAVQPATDREGTPLNLPGYYPLTYVYAYPANVFSKNFVYLKV